MSQPQFENPDSKSFYRAFEDRHRGSRELIKGRLRQYASFLTPLLDIHPQGHVLDLGCGRGEWLEVTRELGFHARGVDLDAGMLSACAELGLDARQEDLVESLQASADESLCVVSAFHVVEHIPFETIQTVIREAWRALAPGGLLILETPNPENLVVGTNNFYLDPSHIRPLPSLLLEFCAEYAGFHRVKTLRLQETPSLHGAKHIHLIDVLSGASPDYAVISQKYANGEVLDRFNEAFQKDFGLSLGELATRHDTFAQRQLDETKIHLEQTQSQIHAELAAKHAELEHQIAQDYALADRLTALLNEEQKLRTQAQAREDELRQQAEQQLQAQQATAAQLAEHLQAQIAQAQQRHEAHEAQQQNALTELRHQLETQRTQAQAREDELRQQAEQQLQAQQATAAQQAEHLQVQIAQAQQRYEAHEAQHQSALAELHQQLEEQRTQARAREDELRQHAAQQLQAQQATAAQQAEHLQAQMNTQIVALLESIQQQTAYAQDLAKHIDTMRSTWWWRISMLWRRPSKWRLPIAPVLTHPFNTPLAVENPNPTAESSGGETPNAPQPSTNP